MSDVAPQVWTKRAAAAKIVGVDFARQFGDNATLLQGGTVTITSSPSGLTIGTGSVITATRRINGRNCAAGEAVTFLASGGTAGTTYEISLSVPGAVGGVASSEVYTGRVVLNVN